jgi:hypothetical protein
LAVYFFETFGKAHQAFLIEFIKAGGMKLLLRFGLIEGINFYVFSGGLGLLRAGRGDGSGSGGGGQDISAA